MIAGGWRAAAIGAGALVWAAWGCAMPDAGGGPALDSLTALPAPATATRAPATADSAPLPPFGDCTEESGMLVPPELVEVEPNQAEAGERVRVVGSGGYLQCGDAYNEAAREFQLYWDDDALEYITCYANRCEAVVALPEDATPGAHLLSAEGGSRLEIEVRASD